MRALILAFAFALPLSVPLPGFAQNFTTSAGVKPILELIRPQWVAIRPYDGRDLLYFTILLSYRCGIEEIRYSVNDGPMQAWDAEPCYRDEAAPMAMKMEGHLPYIAAPLDSLQSVSVELEFDDGTVMTQSYARKEVQIN